MQVALIPPVCQLHRTAGSPLQMMIPEAARSIVYRRYYKMLGVSAHTHVILDNGMFETGSTGQFDHIKFLEMAKEYKVDELVMPDVQGDTTSTIKLSQQFLHTYEIWNVSVGMKYRRQFMAVLQGDDGDDLKACFDLFLSMEEEFEQTFIIGLPRWTTEKIDPEVRIRLVEHIQSIAPHTIHLLGMSRAWPKEVSHAARNYPGIIRGVDTDAPFVWTAASKQLGKDEGVERPRNYFDMDPAFFPNDQVNNNINTLGNWADGRY